MKHLLVKMTTCNVVAALLTLNMSSHAQEQNCVPQPFMDLYHDFTGVHDGSSQTIAQHFADALEKKEQMGAAGPLILVIESGIYVYDHKTRKLIASTSLRSDDAKSGFYELTAISHVGPAIAYLANLKELGDPYWRKGLEKLLGDIEAVAQVNAAASEHEHWIDQSTSAALKLHKAAVVNMVDYACSSASNYIRSVLATDGKTFTAAAVSRDFFNAKSKTYPIPFKNVMVGTFAMVALSDACTAYSALSNKGIDWSLAKVLIQFHAGTNYGGGITKESNHLYQLLRLMSQGQLPADRIFFTPYAQIRPALGQSELPVEDYDYYTRAVWYHQYARPRVAVSGSFSAVPDIVVPGRPPLPGDGGYSKASAIDDFMMRMKYSLGNNTELLSNTIGFWISHELSSKGWDASAVAIPGVTAGFPRGLSGYPLSAHTPSAPAPGAHATGAASTP